MSLRPGSRFRSVYRTGQRERSGGLTVLHTAGLSAIPEVGVVAGKNIGNAVRRNRAKRRLREAARRVDLRPNTAYVVVASVDVLDVQFDELVGWFSAAVAPDGVGNKDRR